MAKDLNTTTSKPVTTSFAQISRADGRIPDATRTVRMHTAEGSWWSFDAHRSVLTERLSESMSSEEPIKITAWRGNVQLAANDTSQWLPPKYQQMLDEASRLYQDERYNEALALCDEILAKYPSSGHTWSVKALITYMLGQEMTSTCQASDEYHVAYGNALDLARKGIRLTNGTLAASWHVLGIIYWKEFDWERAKPCYLKALEIDPNERLTLRDLAVISVQVRDIPLFNHTAHRLLTLDTTCDGWLRLAVAQHLLGDVRQAADTIDGCKQLLSDAAHERLGIVLYKTALLAQSGRKRAALRVLQDSEFESTLDFLEERAQLLFELGHLAEAESIYKRLLSRNSENVKYHAGLQACVLNLTRPVEAWAEQRVTPQVEEALMELYAELEQMHGKSTLCKQLPLEFARNLTYFRDRAAAFLLQRLGWGVPYLSGALTPLYQDAGKARVLRDLVKGWQEALIAGTMRDDRGDMLVWVRVLRAWQLAGNDDVGGAVAELDTAIDEYSALGGSASKLADLHVHKARVLEQAGALDLSLNSTKSALQLEPTDTGLRTLVVRNLLLVDQIGEATQTFTNNASKESNNFAIVISEDEFLRYGLRLADSLRRLKRNHAAIDKFQRVEQVLSIKDRNRAQLDFHKYGIQKRLLRPYVDMLRFFDTLNTQPLWVEAALGSARLHVALACELARKLVVSNPANADAAHLKHQLGNAQCDDARDTDDEDLFVSSETLA